MSKKNILFLFVIFGIFYLSWLPDPSLKNETYFPKWLLEWSNHYYNLRTAIPFLAVGFLLAANQQQRISDEIRNGKNFNFIQNIGIATIIVGIAEIGQFLIRNRSPDLMDVFYGILGSLIGAYSYNLFKKVKDAK